MSIFRFAKDYILHRLTAKNRHGVHSPFVYSLVDETIYDYRTKEEYVGIEKLRKELLIDKRSITVTDLGAGSQLNNNRQKKISDIARNALKPAHLAQLIFRLARKTQPGNIIELGTCLGLTTAYLASAAPQAEITSIEGCPNTAAIASENLSKLGVSNVNLKTGNFDTVFPEVLRQFEVLDFVFVDGNHRKEATLEYFKLCRPKVNENSMLIFDDIYWSRGMKEAWDEIKNHPDVTVTVDLFWIGLVFFRQGRVKEHFKIKY